MNNGMIELETAIKVHGRMESGLKIDPNSVREGKVAAYRPDGKKAGRILIHQLTKAVRDQLPVKESVRPTRRPHSDRFTIRRRPSAFGSQR